MIECYTWTTDNGYKPRMMLEETGLRGNRSPASLLLRKHRAEFGARFQPA